MIGKVNVHPADGAGRLILLNNLNFSFKWKDGLVVQMKDLRTIMKKEKVVSV